MIASIMTCLNFQGLIWIRSYLLRFLLIHISWLCGFQIYYYHEFQANVDSAKLYNDLRWNVTRPQGLECVMRVRCSNVSPSSSKWIRFAQCGDLLEFSCFRFSKLLRSTLERYLFVLKYTILWLCSRLWLRCIHSLIWNFVSVGFTSSRLYWQLLQAQPYRCRPSCGELSFRFIQLSIFAVTSMQNTVLFIPRLLPQNCCQNHSHILSLICLFMGYL